jgi:hypothetical protein
VHILSILHVHFALYVHLYMLLYILKTSRYRDYILLLSIYNIIALLRDIREMPKSEILINRLIF